MRIAGRVKSLRSSGAKLKFYDLAEGEDRIQARCASVGLNVLHALGCEWVQFLFWQVRSSFFHLLPNVFDICFYKCDGDVPSHQCFAGRTFGQVMCSPQMHEGDDFKEVHASIHRGAPWQKTVSGTFPFLLQGKK